MYGELQQSANEGSEAFARNSNSLDTQMWRYTVLVRWHSSGTTAYIQYCILFRPSFLQQLCTMATIEQPTIRSSSTAEEVLNRFKVGATARIYASKQTNCSWYLRPSNEQQGEIHSTCWFLLHLLQSSVSSPSCRGLNCIDLHCNVQMPSSQIV